MAEKPVGAAASKEAKEAAAQKKKDGKKEDAYEMAVAYTKEGDFPGWYSDVSRDPLRPSMLTPFAGPHQG